MRTPDLIYIVIRLLIGNCTLNCKCVTILFYIL
jgi:hypothetical protein